MNRLNHGFFLKKQDKRAKRTRLLQGDEMVFNHRNGSIQFYRKKRREKIPILFFNGEWFSQGFYVPDTSSTDVKTIAMLISLIIGGRFFVESKINPETEEEVFTFV